MSRLFWRQSSSSDYWRDITWLAAGTAVAQAINLLGMPLLTRLYEPAAFGVLSIFTQAVAFASVLITLRYEYAVMLPRSARDAAGVLWLVAALALAGTAAATILLIAAQPWLHHLAAEVPLAVWLLVPPLAGLSAMVLALQHDLQREAKYRLLGAAEVATKTSYLVLAAAAALVLPRAQALALAAATLLAMAVRGAWLLRGSDRRNHVRLSMLYSRGWRRIALRQWRQHAALSRSMLLSHLLMTGTGLAPTLYIGHAFGADTLGQWALVVSTTYLPSALVGAAIGNVYFQRAAQAHAARQPLAPLWRDTARRLMLLGVPAFVVLAAAARWLYPWLFGPKWVSAGEFAAVMALAAGLGFVSGPMDRTCIAVGAWRYIPAWHALRLLTTLAVIAASHRLAWTASQFVLALTLQMALMYLVDFVAEWYFAQEASAR